MDILNDYDDAIGAVPLHVAKIPAMEEWLAAKFEAGTLDTFDSKQISRKQFYEEFEINGVTLLRHPEIAALLFPYDEKVAAGKYLPTHQREKIALLVERCSSPEFIDRNGSKFSWEKASREVGLTVTVLNRPPYLAVIQNLLSSHRKAIERSPFVVTKGGRDFSFAYLCDLGWTDECVGKIASQFLASFGSKSDTWRASAFQAKNDFLKWFSIQTAHHVKHCADLAKSGKTLSIQPQYWGIAHSDYGAAIRARYPNVDSRNSRFKSANAALEALVDAGVIPEVLIPYSNDRATEERHIPSLGEALPKGSALPGKMGNADHYLAFAKQKFAEAASKGYDVDIRGNNAFLENLQLEIASGNTEVGQKPDEVISKLMQRRLELIEAECRRRLEASRTAFEYGQRLVKKGIDPDIYWDKLFGPGVKKQTTSKLIAEYFPPEAETDQGLANLLAFVAKRYHSVYPANTSEGVPEGAFFQKRARLYGGLDRVQAFLMPTTDAVGSTLTLYQCASGVNISVGRTSFVDCVEPSQAKNHSSVTGSKARAQGKPIYVDLLTSSTAIKGMLWLKEALAPVRLKMGADDANLLFVVRVQGAIKALDERNYREFFKDVVDSIPELAQLRLTPNMIRPTVLLLSVINGDGSTRISQALGQHGSNDHQGYTNKFPTMLQRDGDIRDFVDLFETVTLDDNEKMLGLIGVTAGDLEARLKRATATGFGVLCSDPYGKPGNDGQKCTTMNCWDRCSQIIVLARKQDIAILILWQRSLLEVEGDWIRDRPERWLHVWLPWLTFVNTVQDKLRGRYEHVWRDATDLANKIAAHPNYRHHRIS
ncbi:hypothetical protein [Rhizobium leguminosarum]|uniref:hypothetical protein n=1 Tax=Rhizobium leguminosarum TaxID=384 RepID=UPI001C9513AE|nr:hypothetical protein [Rhizobium leguminosarum]MBY5431019.1 hypothetical protein [Rhizobium leguminosarum]